MSIRGNGGGHWSGLSGTIEPAALTAGAMERNYATDPPSRSKMFLASLSRQIWYATAGEQPAEGYPVRLIADDETKARSFRRVFY